MGERINKGTGIGYCTYLCLYINDKHLLKFMKKSMIGVHRCCTNSANTRSNAVQYNVTCHTPLQIFWGVLPMNFTRDGSNMKNMGDRKIAIYGKSMGLYFMMTPSNGNISALRILCGGNPPATYGFLSQRPVRWSFDFFFGLRLNKRLSKQSTHRWFETPSH